MQVMGTHRLASIDSVQAAFAAQRYVADRDLATAVYLSLTLDRPLLVEGEAGVGKTDVGRTLAAVLETELIAEVAAASVAGVEANDDIHASAAYRTHLGMVAARRALAQALARAG